MGRPLDGTSSAKPQPRWEPIGGHAGYLNRRTLYDHMFGTRDAKTGAWTWPALDLVRLAIPRRTYTQSHMDYVVEGIIELHRRRREIRGLRFVDRPAVLPQFTATFEML